MRTPLGVLVPHPAGAEPLFGSVWLIVLSSQALLLTIAIAFVLMAMAKERAAQLRETLVTRLGGIPDQRELASKLTS